MSGARDARDATSGAHDDARPAGRSGLALHYAPPRGRFGDPKPIVHDGRAHVFFQTSPRPDGFDTMRWGHAVSDDLLRWTTLDEALRPSAEGPDAYGCWTGCVIRDGERFHAFYTGVGGPGGRHQTVCRAESDDLATWRKDPANPLVVPQPPFATGPDAAWRDPQVRRLPGGGFEMVLTAELDRGPRALRACVARLLSDDLRTWRVDGVLHHPADVHRCECPEVVPLGGGYVLLYSDYGVQVRRSDDPRGPYRRGATTQLDDFRWYAAKTALDGDRRLVFAFAFDRLASGPAAAGTQATVAAAGEAVAAEDEPDDGSPWTWGGAMAFPRQLVASASGDPALRPVVELDRLRAASLPIDPDVRGALGDWRAERDGDAWSAVHATGVGASELALLPLGRQTEQLEIAFRARWPDDGLVGVLLYADEEVSGGYRVELDRRRGDLTLRRLIPHRNPASPVLQRMPLPLDLPDDVEVRALLDGSLLELFIAGRVAFTGRLYQRVAGPRWGVTARGPASLRGLRAWRLALPPRGG